MNSDFVRCEACGAPVYVSETQKALVVHVVCRDALACDRRVRQNDVAYLDALSMRLERIEAERSEIIQGIADWYKRTGTPNPIDEKHKAEMARIIAES